MGQDRDVVIGGCDGALVVQRGAMANRHGLIAGATGTGKTVSLQVLAEGFSRIGTPVFAVDVKGDLTGISQPGRPHREIDRRLAAIPLGDYQQRGCPTVCWDVFGTDGHPIRTTISELGPLIRGSLLELNDTQTGILYAAFAVADDQGLLLLDLKDLRAMLSWMGEHASELRATYGNISPASVGAIQRRLLILEQQGAEHFFGEPAVALDDLMRTDFNGNGVISLLAASRLLQESPRLYAALLLWLLAELFEDLPEAGELEAPKLALFFDEAHLMFAGMPKPVLDKIEQVVRLIRSKGVGVYFVTQSPLDIPDPVLGQLGLKVLHGLRAYTPADQRTIRAVAQGFRTDGSFDVATAVTELAVGEALVSALLPDGAPGVVRRTLIRPPESRIGPVTTEERQTLLERSPLRGRYDAPLDRESAYELLGERAEQAARRESEQVATRSRARSSGRSRQSVGEALLKSAARSVGSSLGRRLVRGLLGSLLK